MSDRQDFHFSDALGRRGNKHGGSCVTGATVIKWRLRAAERSAVAGRNGVLKIYGPTRLLASDRRSVCDSPPGWGQALFCM